MKKTVAALLFFLSVLPLFAEDPGRSGIISGAGWSFRISAPPGWIHDAKSMARQNIQGLFYKEGTAWNPGVLHIYINPLSVPESTDLETFIFNDTMSFRSLYKTARCEYDHDYVTSGKQKIVVYRLDDPVLKYWQYIGYLKIGGMIYIFVLSARTPEERAENRAAYEQLLDSFDYEW